MSEQSSHSRGRFAWLRGLAKLCRKSACGLNGRGCLAIEPVDDKLKRDIGIGVDAATGVGDIRQKFYRKMLERGQPLL